MTTDLSPDLAAALEALPKVELHCHIEGTMRPATVMDLARRNGIPLPTDDVQELYRYSSLDTFLEIFWLVQSVLVDRDDWARLAYESVVDAAAHGRVYAETFFTPARHLAAGASFAGIVAGLDDGIRAAEDETGARCALICDFDRAYGPVAARELATELIRLRHAGAPGIDRVLGVGLDSTEIGVDPRSYLEAYSLAAADGLRRTAHQGEDTGPEAIGWCLDVLGAERIDHGLSLPEDPQLQARVAAERIPLTMCPTSNVVIANKFARVEDHPLPRLRAAGVLATVNTDDPAMTALDLGLEYRSVAAAFDYGWDEMVQIALDGVEATWLDPSDRSALAGEIRRSATELDPS